MISLSLQYPVKSWEELNRYNIMLLAECYLKEKDYIIADQQISYSSKLQSWNSFLKPSYLQLNNI